MSVAFTFPAIRARMGSTDYFQVAVPARDLASVVIPVSELREWKQWTISERFQRDLALRRIQDELIPYLVRSADGVFGSLIVLVYKPEVFEFEPIEQLGARLGAAYRSQAECRPTSRSVSSPMAAKTCASYPCTCTRGPTACWTGSTSPCASPSWARWPRAFDHLRPETTAKTHRGRRRPRAAAPRVVPLARQRVPGPPASRTWPTTSTSRSPSPSGASCARRCGSSTPTSGPTPGPSSYAERHLAGLAIFTGFVESTVNQVISKRMVKRQQMRWTPRGAHLLVQVRTHVLNDALADDFHRWYPGYTHTTNRDDLAA